MLPPSYISNSNMSRRRKRKKNLKGSNQKKTNSQPTPKDSEPTEPTEPTPLSKEQAPQKNSPPPQTPPQTSPPAIDDELEIELEIELEDSLEIESDSSAENRDTLPSGANKKQMRTPRQLESNSSFVTQKSNEEPQASETQSNSPANTAKSQMWQSKDPITGQNALEKLEKYYEEQSDLQELDLEKEIDKPDNGALPTDSVTTQPEEEPLHQHTAPPVGTSPAQSSNIKSILNTIKERLKSLSLLEQISSGLLILILIVAAFWSIQVFYNNIPNTIQISKLKFPLKGDSAALAQVQTYWRKSIFEGANKDKGVSETINLLPEVKIQLDASSKAKALRFLFRDEEGRSVGDSSTVRMSGQNFLPSEINTVTIKGNSATIHATTGFQNSGELIAYLADDNFQWEIVIYESENGSEFKQFITIPISAIRNDKS